MERNDYFLGMKGQYTFFHIEFTSNSHRIHILIHMLSTICEQIITFRRQNHTNKRFQTLKNHFLYSTAHEQERLRSPENPAVWPDLRILLYAALRRGAGDNGLPTYDRIPKCDPAKIREINSRYRHNIVSRWISPIPRLEIIPAAVQRPRTCLCAKIHTAVPQGLCSYRKVP